MKAHQTKAGSTSRALSQVFSSETFQDGASQPGPGVEPSRTAVVPRKETGFRLMTSHLRSLARGPASIRSGSKEAVGNNGLTRVENRLFRIFTNYRTSINHQLYKDSIQHQ